MFQQCLPLYILCLIKYAINTDYNGVNDCKDISYNKNEYILAHSSHASCTNCTVINYTCENDLFENFMKSFFIHDL